MDKKKPTFEQALNRLDEIVKSLESGTTPLDKSLSLFEEGVTLSTYCNDLLEKAEQKVSILIKTNNGKINKEDFIGEAKNNELWK